MQKLLRNHLAKEVAVYLVLFSVLAAVALAVLVHYHPVLRADVAISREVQEDGSIPMLAFMELVSTPGMPPVAAGLVLATAGIFYLMSRKREALFTLATLLADGVAALFKLVVARPRPTDTAVVVYQKLTDASFPSGHVVHYVVFFGFLVVAMFVVKEIPHIIRVLVCSVSLSLIVLVSISRIYLGAHWATDVIGGYFTGFVLLAALLYFYFKGLKITE